MTSHVANDVFAPTADRAWVIEDDGSDALRESSRESRFAVSNGFLGVRCSRAMHATGPLAMPPRTYVAGLFDTSSPEGPVSVLVPAADWLELKMMVNGEWAGPEAAEMAPHRLILDMKRGMLFVECRQRPDAAPGLAVRMFHLVSLGTRALGLQRIEITAARAGIELGLEAFLGDTALAVVSELVEQRVTVWQTKTSGKRLGMAVASAMHDGNADLALAATGATSRSWRWTSSEGGVVTFERMVAFARADGVAQDAGKEASAALDAATGLGWRGVLAEHEAAWAHRWSCSDVVVTGDDDAQRALRFAVYHLNGAPDPTDERVSIGARGLTGEDYHGHVFWDTEIYLVPFYVMTWPQAARALLMYRFHTLDGARAKASRMGWPGALYAWESADTGAETAPDHVIGPDRRVVAVLSGRQEQHISADVAYAVWNYWQVTRDEEFLLAAGAEILLETGRFWAGRATLDSDGTRHIRGVIGPDEYHENVDDNAFTNVMARWNIRRALEVAALVRTRWPERWGALTKSLVLTDIELDAWREAAETIVTGFDAKTGLYEEFAGYFGLENVDVNAYAGRSVPMDVVLGRERTQRSQVVKQADVVALLALLPEEFPAGTDAINFRYYEPRCGQGSSLSPAMHALVAARLGDDAKALSYFEDTAKIDLRETHAAIEGGIHIAAQGGLWMTAVFGFAGLALRDDGIVIEPRLPPHWTTMRFCVRWRGRRLDVAIDASQRAFEIALEPGTPMKLYAGGAVHAFDAGPASRRIDTARLPAVAGTAAL